MSVRAQTLVFASSAAHAQHMTSHIFIAMGMWDDVVKANEIATAVTNRQMEAMKLIPRMCGHYNFWLEYGYLQQGRVQSARAVLDGCRKTAERTAPARSVERNSNCLKRVAAIRANITEDKDPWRKPEFPCEAA